MKKLIFIVFLMVSYASFAQMGQNETKYPKTTFGVKGGVSHGELSGDKVMNSDGSYSNGLSSTNYYVGLFSETALNDRWAIGNEILFSYTDDIHYIQIPVHLKYRFLKKFQVFAGPRLDFVLKQKEVETTWEVKNTLGISADIGVQYQITKHLFTELRYSYGFTEQLNDYSTYANAKLSTFRLGVGLQF